MAPPAPGRDDTEPVVKVRDLETSYGERKVLRGVNLSLMPGEIMVIMGGSGSGKSTLLRYILGLGRPDSGFVRVLGADINRVGGRALHQLRRNMGVAFQGGALFGSMTVLENIMFPLQEHTNLDRRTMAIMARLKLELVNLSGHEHRHPAELSGGMVKRAALARAVVMDPKLLFFDEPTAGLDPVVAAELDELIVRLRDSMHISILIVTHDLDSVARIADRVTVLDEGRIVMVGTLEEIRHSPSGRVQALLTRTPGVGIVDEDAYLRLLTGD